MDLICRSGMSQWMSRGAAYGGTYTPKLEGGYNTVVGDE